MAAFLNANGLLIRTGADQGKRGSHAAVTNSVNKTVELMFEVDLTGAARTIFSTDRDKDGTNDGFSGLDTPIPSGALIITAHVLNITTPAGGTSFSVGTYQIDGTPISATGILAAGTTTAAGANGALIGTQVAQNSYVAVNTLGTYTAGKIKVLVKYLVR